jgi:Lon protease-like protein
MNKINLPIFPLPVFLLPNGITRLRIFEPRDLKMVKIATKEQGFVITPNYNDTNNSNFVWGTWVEIINFHQGDNGILEIDVKSNYLVEISSLDKEKDNLLFGDISIIEHWCHKNEL